MNLRQEDLQNIAKTAGFRAEMLEKVIRLLDLHELAAGKLSALAAYIKAVA